MTATVNVNRRIEAHLGYLTTKLGSRPGGSEANRLAAEYIAEQFRSYGLDVEKQAFSCPAWEVIDTRLTVDGIALPAVANRFSPGCDTSGIGILIGTMRELEQSELNERIAILYGDLTKTPLSPKSWALTSERDARIIQLLEEKAPSAVITIQQRADSLERLIEDPDFAIPSATVSARDGLWLMRAVTSAISLRIRSIREPGETWNVIARTPGDAKERVVLCAHYDTKFDTPGALDNAGGVSVLLGLAEQFGSRTSSPPVEFIAFGNEENVPEGTGIYLDHSEGELDSIIALLNFDGIGHALDVNTVAGLGLSTTFADEIEQIRTAFQAIEATDPWLESNHGFFAWRGVPSLAFTSPAARHLSHLRDDTAMWVSPDRLADVAQFAIRVVEAIADRSPLWTRPDAEPASVSDNAPE